MKNDNILNNLYDIMNKLIDKDGKDKKMEDNKSILSNNLKEDENRDKKLKKIINKIERIIKDKDVDLDLINNIIESENYHNKHEHKHHKCKHHKHHKHHNHNNKQHDNEEDIKNKKQEKQKKEKQEKQDKQDKHKKEEDENKKIISIIESSDSSSSPYSKLKRNITLQHNGIKNNYSKGKYNEKELEEEIDRVLGIRQN